MGSSNGLGYVNTRWHGSSAVAGICSLIFSTCGVNIACTWLMHDIDISPSGARVFAILIIVNAHME